MRVRHCAKALEPGLDLVEFAAVTHTLDERFPIDCNDRF